jgi:hypothetical protein
MYVLISIYVFMYIYVLVYVSPVPHCVGGVCTLSQVGRSAGRARGRGRPGYVPSGFNRYFSIDMVGLIGI